MFGGITYGHEGQYRTVVATTSKAKLRECLGLSITEARDHWVETGNEIEVTTAKSEPGAIFRRPLDSNARYEKYVPE